MPVYPNIEKKLVTQLKLGNEEAFIAIYKHYSPILTSFLARMNIPSADIEDVVQQSFLKLWEARDRIDTEASFKNYIITIAKNDIYNKIQRNITAQTYTAHTVAQSYSSEELQSTELEEVLQKILLQLPEKRRKVFEMSRLQGYSNSEIAKELEITKSTVENHINNSSSLVKRILKSLGFSICIFIFF
ncbi:RNA polymerase sigma factor [Sphingobacterium tabacisoli]|uniref:RNA polymerase sigma factor n=1 Tax=Sphingobacterium tabacisoli TaxID=2044855 RepID=A0ABW5L747_9SPHI|nr:sigma-70 family RNA polymerase sigma factor [Sphingobacterium tabacisoli]